MERENKLGEKISESIWNTEIEGLYYIERPRFDDERGFFREVINFRELAAVTGKKFEVAQVNHSHSIEKVGRGLHAEGWNKIVSVVNGVAYCVIADIRHDSPTFGKTQGFYLGVGEGVRTGALYVGKGLANSLCVVEGPVDYVYFVDREYADRDKADDKAISFFDSDLAIEWPIPSDEIILSDRDKQTVTMRELFPEKYKK